MLAQSSKSLNLCDFLSVLYVFIITRKWGLCVILCASLCSGCYKTSKYFDFLCVINPVTLFMVGGVDKTKIPC